MTWETSSGIAEFHDVTCSFRIRTDPMGYVVKYEVKANVEIPCIRCGQALQIPVEHADWVSLRTGRPEEGHVVLGNDEMNIRFISEPAFDEEQFVGEAIELECPTYPRHEEDDSSCKMSNQEHQEESEPASPFSVLSKYLDT
ncbi:YceD family protein [Acanthopleuribacter pedis]|uniref:DUF177 domain-containing protein n=1 Tax=Acanthopleuribacter pedis TaxID=442870 RepID=A0A8J7Q4E3_9BACT|nr:YceD family protein [Acanthopleuribacter pedis]MBO1320377.1 DUF177 domain-containing protein [Acanthopleuribacter pedis]